MRPCAPNLRRSLIAALVVAGSLFAHPAEAAPADEPLLPAFEGTAQRLVTATAYTSGPESTGKRPGHPQYGLTFTGTHATEGRTIAVDPGLIPLGSLVYIHELGETRIAEDTGGAIKGPRIDLYMDQVGDAINWGIRRVRIQVYPKI